MLPKFAATSNPVDLTGSVTDDMFEVAADLMFQDSQINGIILLGLHHLPALCDKYIDSVAQVSKQFSKPIVMCDIGETELALYTRFRFVKLGRPSYPSPEDAARAMRALATYGAFLKKNDCAEAYLTEFLKRRNNR